MLGNLSDLSQCLVRKDISSGEVMDWLMLRTEESDDMLDNDDHLNNNTPADDDINGNMLESECEDSQMSNTGNWLAGLDHIREE